MGKDTLLAKIFGEDVENVHSVLFIDENTIEIENFRGREKHYKMQVLKSKSGALSIERVKGNIFQILD